MTNDQRQNTDPGAAECAERLNKITTITTTTTTITTTATITYMFATTDNIIIRSRLILIRIITINSIQPLRAFRRT